MRHYTYEFVQYVVMYVCVRAVRVGEYFIWAKANVRRKYVIILLQAAVLQIYSLANAALQSLLVYLMYGVECVEKLVTRNVDSLRLAFNENTSNIQAIGQEEYIF